ncbi:hypothetical protein [Methylobacterium nigriterrae]|uniref:hypothetical protein n=1 Tax=Methylobacterium nigriterrae TaxID=3127512 RepID=UPI0030133220
MTWKLLHRQPAGHLHGDALGWWKGLARTQGPLAAGLFLNLVAITILLWLGWLITNGLQ